MQAPLSSNNSCLPIPQEIVDHIIDEAKDDKLTLKACSLASSTLLAPSRKHLFGRITFSGENKAHYEDFYHLALANPSLLTYVRGLRIDGLAYVRPERTILPLMLKLFTNLRSFSLVSRDYTVSWDSLGLQLQVAFLNLIRSTPLTHVDVDIVSWPLNSFFHCHQLQELVVPFPAFKDPSIPRNVELIPRKAGFQVLHLGGSVHELCSSFGVSHPDLRKLTICCWSALETTVCQAILRSAANSLEELQVTLRNEANETFPALPNLRHLSVQGKGLKVIRWLVCFLKDFAGENKLWSVSVSVSGVTNTPDDKIWGELNALVATSTMFPDLSQVNIFFDDDLGLTERKRAVSSFLPYLTFKIFQLTFPTIEDIDM